MSGNIRRKTAQAIRVPGMGVEYFLIRRVNSTQREIRRKLLSRRLGVIPEKLLGVWHAEITRLHPQVHSRVCYIEVGAISPKSNGTNTLDDIHNGDVISRGPASSDDWSVDTDIAQKYLGLNSGYKKNVAEKKP